MRQLSWYFIVTVAAAQPAAEPLADQARRILDANCASCHAAAKMGGLDLRDRDNALAKGAIRPGDPAASRLVQAVERTGDLKMPPGKKPLSAAEIAVLRTWIQAGAPWSSASGPAEPSWWSFKKLRRPQGQSIDEFINAALRKRNLAPNGPADRRTLIRRAYLDLHGLPPSPADVEAFVADPASDAWPKLIDKLLASPRYGERWGRHWLDVVRYADTGGFETDIYFPNAWRYRDYVIKAFNDDKPFARFVREQIAGDELYPDDLDLDGGFQVAPSKLANLDARIATGLYTIGPVYHEAALFGGQDRYEWLTDVADTTGEAFLGLSFGCARCHNHKFDPITQRDYHSMMAIFAGSEEREVPVIPRFNIFGFKSGYPNWLRVEELKSAIQRIDSGARKRVVDKVRSQFPAPVLAAYDVHVDKRTPQQRELAAKLEKALTEAGLQENAQGKDADIPLTPEEHKRREELIVELGKAALKANPVMATATVLGHAATVPDIHITHRGDWRAKGEKVPPAFPAALSTTPIEEPPGARLARRSALANWLTAPGHPLAARVYVNRVWHWHFGRGIVATPNDFGRQGEEPTHPELLDWLASEFLDKGGSTKRLHRAIMLSDAYQRSSAHNAANATSDADNRYLWRANRLRMDAETLRDSVLAASGALNTKMGGRPVIPALSKEEYATMWARSQWPESLDPAEHNRRTVYLYVKRSFPMPMLTTFDAPDTSVSCSRRDATTVAPQALTLMNGAFMIAQSQRFAGRLRAERPNDNAAQIDLAWRIALGRPPAREETLKAAAAPSLEKLCLVLLNMNEFLYVD